MFLKAVTPASFQIMYYQPMRKFIQFSALSTIFGVVKTEKLAVGNNSHVIRALCFCSFIFLYTYTSHNTCESDHCIYPISVTHAFLRTFSMLIGCIHMMQPIRSLLKIEAGFVKSCRLLRNVRLNCHA